MQKFPPQTWKLQNQSYLLLDKKITPIITSANPIFVHNLKTTLLVPFATLSEYFSYRLFS